MVLQDQLAIGPLWDCLEDKMCRRKENDNIISGWNEAMTRSLEKWILIRLRTSVHQ